MSRSLKVAGAAALGLFVLPALAAAQTMAVATTDVNMRAGPGTGYAVVGVVPGHHYAVVHGCSATTNWCEVSYGAMTGWSHSRYLALESGRVAIAGPPPDLAVAGPPPDAVHAPARHPGAPLIGAASGALVGGLVAGPPGAIIGGFAGGLMTPR